MLVIRPLKHLLLENVSHRSQTWQSRHTALLSRLAICTSHFNPFRSITLLYVPSSVPVGLRGFTGFIYFAPAKLSPRLVSGFVLHLHLVFLEWAASPCYSARPSTFQWRIPSRKRVGGACETEQFVLRTASQKGHRAAIISDPEHGCVRGKREHRAVGRWPRWDPCCLGSHAPSPT